MQVNQSRGGFESWQSTAADSKKELPDLEAKVKKVTEARAKLDQAQNKLDRAADQLFLAGTEGKMIDNETGNKVKVSKEAHKQIQENFKTASSAVRQARIELNQANLELWAARDDHKKAAKLEQEAKPPINERAEEFVKSGLKKTLGVAGMAVGLAGMILTLPIVSLGGFIGSKLGVFVRLDNQDLHVTLASLKGEEIGREFGSLGSLWLYNKSKDLYHS